MPQQYQGDGLYQYHRDLGVGFYLQGYFPFRTVYDGIEVIEEAVGPGKITTVKTPYGELREVQRWIDESFCIAWTERFMKSWRDLKALRYFAEHTFFEPDYDLAARRYDLVGDNGLVLCYLPRSPFMDLVAITAGIRAVTYTLADAPDEFAETFEVLKRKNDEACEIALHSPAECLMIPENLSSEAVGKRYFNKWVRHARQLLGATYQRGGQVFVRAHRWHAARPHPRGGRDRLQGAGSGDPGAGRRHCARGSVPVGAA